jgi:GntR family transcriptional repressor for pyruvate dehydrogenase complex
MSTIKSILDMVQERKLQPGDRLPSERDLAGRLGVGRNAVREALAGLTALRVLETKPNSGIYLRSVSTESSFETLAMLTALGATPSRAEISESTEVRLTLETLVVQLACARRSEEDLDNLLRVLADTDHAVRDGRNIAELDTAFHLAMAACTHNGVLVRQLNPFYLLTAPRRRAWFENQNQARSSARDHRKLTQAIAARDVAGAMQTIERHMERATAYWSEVLGAPVD